MAPRTSFVIPVRNGAATLAQALASVRDQTVDDWEAIVVDDGSTDESAEIARSFGKRFRVVTQPPQGIVAALHHGVSLCRGQFVARLDSDDIATPSRLRRQLAVLEADPSLCVVDGRVTFFRDGEPVPEGMRRYEGWVNQVLEPTDFDAAMSIESPVVHPAATLRKSALLAAGGYRHGVFPEDYDLWCRLHAAGGRFRKVPEVLVRMRDRPERLTRTDPRYGREAFRRVRWQWLRATHLARPRRVVIAGGGRESRVWGRWLQEQGHIVAGLVDVVPSRWGTTVDGVEVSEPAHLSSVDADVLLVVVSARGREAFRTWMTRWWPRWHEGRNYFFVMA